MYWQQETNWETRRSRDLTPLDCVTWRYLKSVLHKTQHVDIDEIKDESQQGTGQFTVKFSEMFQKGLKTDFLAA